MTTAVGSGETRASRPACLRAARWVRVVAAFVLVTLSLIVPPFGTQPATAAPPALSVTLTQSSADSAIGSDLTLTATVVWSGGESPEPAGGWYVEFAGTADGGWSSGPTATDGGVATYTRTSPVAQTETITARLAAVGCGATSTPVTHEWWEPEITLSETNAATPLGTEFELNGFVTRGADPVTDAAVRVVVDSRTTDAATLVLDAQTDDAGTFGVAWDASEASIERVDATATAADGFIATTTTSHAWSGPEDATQELTLAADQEARVADRLLATSTFSTTDTPDISFWTDQGWLSPTTEDLESGEATFNYAGRSPEGWGILGVRSSETGLHRARAAYWWQPVITFVAPNSRSANGQSYPATVLVTDRGRPIPGMHLAFTTRGEETPFGYDTTDDEGLASVPISGQAGESPMIDVQETADESAPPLPPLHTPATGSTTHAWVSPAAINVGIAVVAPESFESRVGTRVPFTARVTSAEDPLQGWDVAFTVDGDDQGIVATDANGEAVLRATRTTESPFGFPSSIRATVTITGCPEQSDYDETRHYWWETQLDLTPKATTSPARQNVVFTAEVARTVFDEGEVGIGSAGAVTAAAIPEGMAALEGQLIRFTLSSQSCELPVEVREDATNDGGIAEVALSRDGPSIDSVRAEEVGVFDPASDATTHTWGTLAPVPVSITLAQSTPESRAGTDVTYTATVHDTAGPGGHARAGVPVTFLGVSPSRTALTDSNGIARTTIAGTGTTATTITASAPFGCGVVLSGTVTHRWFVPTLELTPVSATSTTGETATVIARLHHGDDNIEGEQIRLTIDSSTAGESTKIMTRPTKSNGTAEFSWVRTKAGTDDLTAIELIAVLPQQDSATHIWEAPPVTPKPDTPTPVTPEPITPPPVVITEPPVTEEPQTDEPSADEPSEPETPTSPPSSPPATEPPSDLPATSKLVDGPEVGRPGADIEVSGNGCQAGQQLTVLLGETELGETRAAADGTFYLRAVVPDLPLGRYVLRSTCGKTIGDPNVDITSPQVDKARAAIAAVGVTTASTFAFFLLIAKGVISFLPRRPL